MLAGDEKRRRAVVRREVNLGAPVEKEQHRRLMALIAGDAKRRRAVVRREIDLGAPVEQESYHCIVSALARSIQGCGSMAVRLVDHALVAPLPQQQSDEGKIARQACLDECIGSSGSLHLVRV